MKKIIMKLGSHNLGFLSQYIEILQVEDNVVLSGSVYSLTDAEEFFDSDLLKRLKNKEIIEEILHDEGEK